MCSFDDGKHRVSYRERMGPVVVGDIAIVLANSQRKAQQVVQVKPGQKAGWSYNNAYKLLNL